MKLSELKKGDIYVVKFKRAYSDSKPTAFGKFIELTKNKIDFGESYSSFDKFSFYWYDSHKELFLNREKIISIRLATKQEIKGLAADEI